MKRSLSRLLGLVLCGAVLLGMMPAVTASAAEMVTARETVRFVEEVSDGVYTCTDEVITTEHTRHREFTDRPEIPMPVSTFSLDTDEEGNLTFTTFADLQALAARTYSERTVVSYIGEGPLVIEADLTLPDLLGVWVPGNTLQVPAGVTLTCGFSTYLFADRAVVDGTLVSAYLNISEALTVNGTLYNNYRIYMEGGAALTGGDRIVYNLENSRMLWWYSVADMSSLNTAAAAAYNAADDNWGYEVIFDQTDVQISESVTLPGNCEVYIEQAVTVASGCTLDLQGYAWVCAPLAVSGTLNNDGVVDIFYDQDGTMTIASGGSYTGSGVLFVNSDTLPEPSDGVPGLDLSDFLVEEFNDEFGHYWELTYAPEAPALAAPTNLNWGHDYNSGNNAPGFISWQASAPDHGKAIVRVYRDGTLYETYGWGFDPSTQTQWRSIDSFCNSDPETGTYRFTVTSTADDGSGYRSSQTVTSANWYYEKPAAQLGACTNLSWNDANIYFDEPEDMNDVDGYEVRLFYAETPSAEPVHIRTIWGRYASDKEYVTEVTDQAGEEGYYYFKVRSLSGDITRVCNGPWSQLSDAYHLTDEEASEQELPFTAQEWEVLRLVNLERYEAGVEPLAGFSTLQQAARLRAQEILEYFDHTRPDGSSCFTVLSEFGLTYNGAGENIALGQRTPAEVMNSWMNSEGHRANILTSYYTQVGIGNCGYGWTQLFLGGNPYDSLTLRLPQTTYPLGTTIDDMGIVAVLHSSNFGDCYMPLLSQYCTGFDPNKAGTQKVTVSVRGFSKTFEVTLRIDMFRLYNPYTQEHLFTSSAAEKDQLVNAGWSYDGIAWNAPASGDPVYRLYNPFDDFHFYTTSMDEVNSLTPLGWQLDGAVCFSASPQDGKPIYRLFNPYEPKCYHLFTASEEERDWLVSLGWQLEGIAWYALK